jgi:hypothetical protein
MHVLTDPISLLITDVIHVLTNPISLVITGVIHVIPAGDRFTKVIVNRKSKITLKISLRARMRAFH